MRSFYVLACAPCSADTRHIEQEAAVWKRGHETNLAYKIFECQNQESPTLMCIGEKAVHTLAVVFVVSIVALTVIEVIVTLATWLARTVARTLEVLYTSGTMFVVSVVALTVIKLECRYTV
jgi:hypothetical protein